MIVHCPSCSTGYHLALPPPAAVLQCSRCRHVVPTPSARRSYALAAASPAARPTRPVREPLPAPPPSVFATVEVAPFPPPTRTAFPGVESAPVPPVASPAMPALDAALFAPPPVRVQAPPARRARRKAESEPAGASALVPLGLAALGAAAAWFAFPRLASWIPLPLALEPWMVAAAGAASGLLLGGMWLKWRAGRR